MSCEDSVFDGRARGFLVEYLRDEAAPVFPVIDSVLVNGYRVWRWLAGCDNDSEQLEDSASSIACCF